MRDMYAQTARLPRVPDTPNPAAMLTTIWTVYLPEAGRHCHHASEVLITEDGPVLTGEHAIGPLDVLRGYLAEHRGLTCCHRSPCDLPNVVETWI